MKRYTSHSAEITRELGQQIGAHLVSGDIVLLKGNLGAGKTELARGIATQFGCGDQVTSPTFSLVNIYQGTAFPVFHIDLYRMEEPVEIHRAGLDEYLEPEGITLIEWAERWPLAGDAASVHIEISQNPDESRSIRFTRC